MWRLGEKVYEAGADGLEVTQSFIFFLASDSNNILITPPEWSASSVKQLPSV